MLNNSPMLEQSDAQISNQLTLFVADFPVKTCRLPDDARGLLESGADYGTSLQGLLMNLSRDGLLSKTSPVFYPVIEDLTLGQSFRGWSGAGMAWSGGYLTLDISESPSAAVECSLSQVLEADAVPKYYLSAKACRGILRRAAKRGKELPERLARALVAVSERKTP